MIDRVAARLGPPPGRSAGGLQVVRRRPARRLARLRRRGKRGRFLPAPRRHRLDHRQGRHHPGPAGRRDHGRARAATPASSTARSPREFGEPVYERIDAPATRRAEARCSASSPPEQVDRRARRRAQSRAMLTTAPGQRRPIGGLKVVTENGWFAARPSGTEDLYKIYAESFLGPEHLRRIQEEAQALLARIYNTRSTRRRELSRRHTCMRALYSPADCVSENQPFTGPWNAPAIPNALPTPRCSRLARPLGSALPGDPRGRGRAAVYRRPNRDVRRRRSAP